MSSPAEPPCMHQVLRTRPSGMLLTLPRPVARGFLGASRVLQGFDSLHRLSAG